MSLPSLRLARTLRHGLLALVLMLAVPVAIAQAQRLDGTLTLGNGNAAAGVVLTARDASGSVLGRSVTRENGRYQLFVDRPGLVRVEAKRVGYAREVIGERTVASNETVALDAQLTAQRITVPEQPPRGSSTCDQGRSGRFAQQAFDEVLTALAAAQYRIGRQDTRARFAINQYRVAKASDDTLRVALRRIAGPLPAPFPPADTARLEADGFFATVGSNRTFFAPDLEVLQTSWFTNTHCVRVRRLVADSLLLDVQPKRQRRGRVDVMGELVLDWPSMALHEFRFRYVDLPETERESGAGGAIRFARTPAGGWVVTDWRQRTPSLNYYSGDGNTTLIRTQMLRVDVVAHVVSGGRVLAMLEDGGTVFQRNPHGVRVAGTPFASLCPERTTALPTAAARGILRDSSGAPLANTVIRASWSVPVIVNRVDVDQREEVREAITDADGAWFLCDLPVEREVTLRWDGTTAEQRVPFRAATAFGVTDVRLPR